MLLHTMNNTLIHTHRDHLSPRSDVKVGKTHAFPLFPRLEDPITVVRETKHWRIAEMKFTQRLPTLWYILSSLIYI